MDPSEMLGVPSNPPPIVATVKQLKTSYSQFHRDIPLYKWGGIAGMSRSALFMIELKKYSRKLWWFQHCSNARIFTLGERARHIVPECKGLCTLCPSSTADYPHVFHDCQLVRKYREAWERRSPAWVASPRDWVGIPDERYDPPSL